MKKTLIALAAVAVSGAAMADVTVFGVVDLAVTQVSGYDAAGKSVSDIGMAPSGMSSSRLGFKSSTDLGEGLSANAWLESNVKGDAKDSTLDIQRRATVGLAGGFGALDLGLQHNASYNAGSAYDPFGDVGVGAAAITGIIKYDSRNANSLNYFLPKNLGGVFGQVTYALGETAEGDTGKYDGQKDLLALHLGYAADLFKVSVGYGSYKGGVTKTTAADRWVSGVWTQGATKYSEAADQAGYSIGGQLNLGAVTPAFTYVSSTAAKISKDAALGISAADSVTTSGYLVAVTVDLASAGKIKASYSNLSNDSDAAKDGKYDSLNKIAVGYFYGLAKNTTVYAIYATADDADKKSGKAKLIGNANVTLAGDMTSGAQLGLNYSF
jgi:predicted porin